MAAQGSHLVPRFARVGRAEQRGVFHSGIDRVGLGQRGFNVPHPLELPRVLRAVVPLMRRDRLARFGRRVIDELVALAFWPALRGLELVGIAAGRDPSFAAVV